MKSHLRGRSRAAASATTVFQRLLLLCCCLPALATAGVDQWTTIGPRGAALRQVVEDPANPSVLYVDDGSVLYRSQNAGASWAPTPTWPTLDPGCVNSYFFPRNGSIYALACGEILWRSSHFYSASPEECALVQQRFPQLVLESSAAFYIALPDTTSGACPTGTIPVFRLWNARVDSNHRYTTDPAIKAQMIAKGHIPEGYGPNQVIMCALQ